jgi:hypothetical protein
MSKLHQSANFKQFSCTKRNQFEVSSRLENMASRIAAELEDLCRQLQDQAEQRQLLENEEFEVRQRLMFMEELDMRNQFNKSYLAIILKSFIKINFYFLWQ